MLNRDLKCSQCAEAIIPSSAHLPKAEIKFMDASIFLGLKEIETQMRNVSLATREKMLHLTERLWILLGVSLGWTISAV